MSHTREISKLTRDELRWAGGFPDVTPDPEAVVSDREAFSSETPSQRKARLSGTIEDLYNDPKNPIVIKTREFVESGLNYLEYELLVYIVEGRHKYLTTNEEIAERFRYTYKNDKITADTVLLMKAELRKKLLAQYSNEELESLKKSNLLKKKFMTFLLEEN